MTCESSPSGMDASYSESLRFTFKTQHLLLYSGIFFRSKLVPSFNNINNNNVIYFMIDSLILYILSVKNSLMIIIISSIY